jgi:hypothetical protein
VAVPRVGGTHERDHRAAIGGTHQWDRCTSLTGSVKDEPGQGDLRDLDVWVWTPGAHCVSFPLTRPTPGVPELDGRLEHALGRVRLRVPAEQAEAN